MTPPITGARRTVLICTPSYYLHGGVERIIEALATGLPECGFRVVVGLARGERFHDPDRYRREYPGLECVEIDGRSGTRLGRVRGVERALDTVRPDLVLIARMFDAYDAVLLRKRCGDPVRLAVTVQAYESDHIVDLGRYAEWVDLCVTSGKLVAEAIRRFTSLPADRVVSIPGGVRPAKQLVIHDETRPLRLGYVGRLEGAQKRIFDLVDTLSGLTARGVPFTCQIAGAGPAEEELHARIRDAGLEQAIVFHGWCSVEKLYRDIYPQLDVLLHFAGWEGITIAPREAMVHGVVPVVSRFTGAVVEGQFLHEVNALTFEAGSVSAAVAAVERLHKDRGLLRRLSCAASGSQEGIRSDLGALAAWAEALKRTLETSSRRGSRLPHLPWPPSGRLERWGLPPTFSETLRCMLGRKYLHTEPGAEWPHSSGLNDAAQFEQVAEFAAAYEQQLEAQLLNTQSTGKIGAGKS